MEYTTRRMLDSEELRNLCIRENWYASGNVKQYMAFLKKAKGEATHELMWNLVEDIYHHTNKRIDDDPTEWKLNVLYVLYNSHAVRTVVEL